MNCTCYLPKKKPKQSEIITKQFTVFLNGYPQHKQKIVINQKRKVPLKWHHILNTITEKLSPYFGHVKKLYSASSGITVNSFTDLENNGFYVASDCNKFRFVDEGYKIPDENEKGRYFEHYLLDELIHTNRKKKLSFVRRDLIVIYVFNNGRDQEGPKKFVFSKSDLFNWEHTLSFIALILDMPYMNIKCLCNSKGHVVCGPWELQHGASYVAVGYHEKFIKSEYKINEDITEIWKDGTPVINKNRYLQCHHLKDDKQKEKNSWKQTMKWVHNHQTTEWTEPDENKNQCECYYYDVDLQPGTNRNIVIKNSFDNNNNNTNKSNKYNKNTTNTSITIRSNHNHNHHISELKKEPNCSGYYSEENHF